ncbi:MAG TPA: AAA family ATPase [Nitrososphaeraceae archaeon]|jgi:Holliday junction DNA helicase RuvB
MFKNLFNKLEAFCTSGQKLSIEEKFFSNIVGYPDIKKVLLKSVVSKDPVSILLVGPPSSSKTIFLLEMLEGLNDSYFIDAFGASGAGIIEHLFNNNTKYLLVDEIDKMKKIDQAALLNVMETGILSETKLKGKTRQKKMKLWIFATSNDVERLSMPLRSRFFELHLDEYTYEEFMEITRRLLWKKYHLDTELSDKISSAVWNKMQSKDIRDVINIAKLSKTSFDINWLTDIQLKYGRRKAS